MKFLIDENVSLAVHDCLKKLGHSVEMVADGPLSGASDQKIFQAAAGKECILVTRDYHFTNNILFPSKSTKGIIYIRRGNLRSKEEADLVGSVVEKYPLEKIDGKLLTLYKNLTTLR